MIQKPSIVFAIVQKSQLYRDRSGIDSYQRTIVVSDADTTVDKSCVQSINQSI